MFQCRNSRFTDTLGLPTPLPPNFIFGLILPADSGAFEEHIEKICKKVRQKSGWFFRTFYSRNTQFFKQLFKSSVQPHIGYCSQLWAPLEGSSVDKIEKLLRDFTRRIPELRELNY